MMKAMFQSYDKRKLVQKYTNWIFFFVLIIYSIIIPIGLSSVYAGIDQTVNSVRFPNSFIEKEFNSTDPWIEFSYLVKNFNRFDLDFELTTSIYAQYYPEHSLNMKEILVRR